MHASSTTDEIRTAGRRVAGCLGDYHLFMAVAREIRTEPDAATIQAALYRIADMASAASDLREFYGAMHQIVSELTYGENLFIALYDEENLLLNYPYYADSVDLEA